ncbi:MAG: metalloregulator ArsR/SmtB family transcription factor [Gammaproteobacteria bacterium]
MLNLVQLFKCLSDETRLRCVLLLQQRGELCVCELTNALQLSQPRISRHLAQLRAHGLLQDRRQGLWVYYRIHPNLPPWALALLHESVTAVANDPLFAQDHTRLQNGAFSEANGCIEGKNYV